MLPNFVVKDSLQPRRHCRLHDPATPWTDRSILQMSPRANVAPPKWFASRARGWRKCFNHFHSSWRSVLVCLQVGFGKMMLRWRRGSEEELSTGTESSYWMPLARSACLPDLRVVSRQPTSVLALATFTLHGDGKTYPRIFIMFGSQRSICIHDHERNIRRRQRTADLLKLHRISSA